MLHLRLTALREQTELNDLVDGFRRDCATAGPLGDEILYHRAALIGLWLTRHGLMTGTRPAQTIASDGPRLAGLRRSADKTS
jgi:hypothetical protein